MHGVPARHPLEEEPTVIHDQPHPYAGQLVPLLAKDSTPGSDKPAAMFRIDDWADRIYGTTWRRKRAFTTTLYSLRAPQLGLPINDDLTILGNLGPLRLLIHTREIDWSRL